MSDAGETGVHSAVRAADGSVLKYAARPPSARCIFFSLRFGPEHGVVPMAEALRAALAPQGAHAIIINMLAGGDINKEVFQWIEHCDTFVVFGSARYGEDTGNQACTHYEYQHAFAKKKRIILLRMIPPEREFEELQARVIFGANKLVLPWMIGKPVPADLPDQILRALESDGYSGPDLRLPETRQASPSASPSAPVAISVASTAPPLAQAPRVGAWPPELGDLMSVPSFVACLTGLGVHSLEDFGEQVDLEEVSFTKAWD
jgi:hypothetical protein